MKPNRSVGLTGRLSIILVAVVILLAAAAAAFYFYSQAEARRDIAEVMADRIYSGVPAADFGREQGIAIGPLSGRSNVAFWLEQRGHQATEPRVSAILEMAKRSNRLLSEEEILAVVRKG